MSTKYQNCTDPCRKRIRPRTRYIIPPRTNHFLRSIDLTTGAIEDDDDGSSLIAFGVHHPKREELLAKSAHSCDMPSMHCIHRHRRDSTSIHVHSPHRVDALSVRVLAVLHDTLLHRLLQQYGPLLPDLSHASRNLRTVVTVIVA